MPKRRSGQEARRFDVADLVELAGLFDHSSRMDHRMIDTRDPTINVKESLTAATGRIDDMAQLRSRYEDKLRDSDHEWQTKMDAERQVAQKARIDAEAARIDNKLSDIVRSADLSTERLTNAATILANTVATTADTAQKALQAAATQQSELVSQVRDSVTALTNVVTSFTAAGGTRQSLQDTERVESRQNQSGRTLTSQWAIGLAVFAGLSFLGTLVAVVGIIVATVTGHIR